MITKKSAVFSICLLSFGAVQARDIFDRMDEMFKEQEKAMKQMRKSMKKSMQITQAQGSVSVDIDDAKDAVKISLKGIQADQVSASYDDTHNRLSIDAGDNKIVIEAQSQRGFNGQYVSLQMERKVEKSGTKKDDGSVEHAMFQSSYVQQGRTINGVINLEQPSIDFDEDMQTLSISFSKKSAGKAIPVHVKKKSGKAKRDDTRMNEDLENEK